MKLAALIGLLLTASAPTYDWKLTPAGWGPVRIGMTRAQTEKALALHLEGDAFDNYGSCIELYSSNQKLSGLYFMFLDGKLSRISANGTSTIKTPRGIHVGSSADEVRKLYGPKLQAEPHHYTGDPGGISDLLVEAQGERRSIRDRCGRQRSKRSMPVPTASSWSRAAPDSISVYR